MMRTGAYLPLALGAVRPMGWLRDQLQVQASGLSGDIEDVWEVLGPKSGWRGGDGESWERGPYYLDGLVPLAWLTEREDLIAKATVWIEWILGSQKEDGAFGPPRPESRFGVNWWYVTPALKALTQYGDVTGDERVVSFLLKWFDYQRRNLEARPLEGWGRARAAEALVVGEWLWRRAPEPWLLDHLRRLVKEGLDWTTFFRRLPLVHRQENAKFGHETHGVNVAMALKYPALAGLLDEHPHHTAATFQGLANLDRHHGQLHGGFSADEHLSGTSPTRGFELCAAVEMMASLSELTRLSGGASFADRLEQVAFNALPAAFDGRMRFRQYLQQVNQVLCTRAMRPWSDNGPEANLFGLAAEDGCCTANYHQGWPRFVSRMWMKTRDRGLATGALGPSEVTVMAKAGHEVTVREQTQYPFGDRVVFQIGTPAAIRFPLEIRIPAWCTEATLDGRPVAGGTWQRLDRTWRNGERVVLQLPRRIREHRLSTGGSAFRYGPLTLALPIPENWEKLPGQGETYGDHEVVPGAPWNFALERDAVLDAEVSEPLVQEVPFDEESPPLNVEVPGRRVPSWDIEQGVAGPVPQRPVLEGETLPLQLVPYGATILRVAAFPVF